MTAETSQAAARSRFVGGRYAGGRARIAQSRHPRILIEQIAEWFAADIAVLSVWTPVAIGAGVGMYFSLKTEPSFAFSAMTLAGAAFLLWSAPRFRTAATALFLVALGFSAADWRAMRVAAPILERELGIRAVEGRVVSVERGGRGERFVVALSSIDGVPSEATPARARISWRGAATTLSAGDIVSLRAGLRPPPPPAAPGGFDFARQLYFQRIGAVGFAVSTPIVAAETNADSFAARVENIRAELTARILDAAPGQGGAIVAAVVTGKREAITEGSRAALRDAGLAHLLAISGLHMGLATGLIFFGVRAGLAAIEPLAVRYPIKKWAAAAALLSGFAYLLLSGGSWSPRRAFIMAAIIFTAILVDRRALSLRNVAIAATIILVTTPEALIHAGFQMSFAAVASLIAIYEWWSRAADPMRDFSWPARLKRYVIGLGVTDLVASLATAPFALYHFNRVAVFSLPANMLAMPLMAFWIMPAAVTGLLLTPLGLDHFAWVVAAAGVDVVLAIGAEVSSWPRAVSLTPQWPTLALLAIVAGGLWFVLARSPLRLAGLLGLPAAILIVRASPAPDIFVAASGENAAVVYAGETGPAIVPYASRREKFSVKVWREAAGASDGAPVSMEEISVCDGKGCALTTTGLRIAIIENYGSLAEDCRRADLVIALFRVAPRDWRACDAVLIDKQSVWKGGAHAVWLSDNDIRIKHAADARGARPWSGAS